MRPSSIAMICLGALAGGACLGVFGMQHPAGVARAWAISGAFFGWSNPATSPVADAPRGGWMPPKDYPVQANWTWHTTDGKTYENVAITKISPTEVSITHSLGIAHIPLDSLPPDVQQSLKIVPGVVAPAVVEGPTPIAAMLTGKLTDSAGQSLPAPASSVKYYAIYYAAGCPSCQTFTPALVDWYGKFKPNHPDFELIFVSEDKNDTDMSSYMKDTKMPWPAVRYAALPRHDGTFKGPDIQQFANGGIPDLVLVDSSGNVLSDSYQGSNYVGPQVVLDYAEAKLGMN